MGYIFEYGAWGGREVSEDGEKSEDGEIIPISFKIATLRLEKLTENGEQATDCPPCPPCPPCLPKLPLSQPFSN